jgi:hypothetical protein
MPGGNYKKMGKATLGGSKKNKSFLKVKKKKVDNKKKYNQGV